MRIDDISDIRTDVCGAMLQKEIKLTYDHPNGPRQFSSQVRFTYVYRLSYSIKIGIHLFISSKNETGLSLWCAVFPWILYGFNDMLLMIIYPLVCLVIQDTYIFLIFYSLNT